ncbi:asparagine synthase-related protein [Pseudalkalibacillus caeni]|uniref:asparagine synthase (glutamine-hydrolyzing) n=1 Tax=Exobacillus caeni TaxID=2574798 RepID=A0A5R9F6Z7_9BACL|nr:asparagine synthase-related protein [Pseudalkalibacillus caeni]TLS35555.1 asparagine synthetase B [Pseudalkalibacillus caeni]
MSAIAGIYHLNDEHVSSDEKHILMKSLERFPSDDIQTWYRDNVFLGCHAQWITPESIGEILPFHDNERKCTITADAIIDNREELFAALQVNREDQKVIPDSLLILLAYYKWGEDCPKYLIGDFAFMIWDEREQKLFGARDPSGYRTLYYYSNDSTFTFCTTIEPLLSLPTIKKQLNEKWLAEYIAISGMIDTVDAHITPYLNIYQIPPFHSVVVSKNKLRQKKYGRFYSGEQIRYKSNEEYVEAFQEVFQSAINSRLRTYKNIGSQLSGGLDSGAVVGFAANELKKQNKLLHTFSYLPPSDFVDYTPKRLMPNETPFIKKTVDYVGGISDHYYHFDGIDSYSEVDSMLKINEMPYKFFENSFWLKGIFEKAGSENIGVLLNGDNGNLTISWGNAPYYYSVLLRKLKWIKLTHELNLFSRNVGGARFRNIPYIASMAFPFMNKVLSKPTSKKPTLINQEFAESTRVYEKLRDFGIDESGWFTGNDFFSQRRMIYDDICPWNAGNTLYAKLSLQHSLWKRDPTNDIRVVRYCLSIPENQYVQNGMDRALIRRSTENILPDQIRLNQKIRGIQAADWVHRIIPHWDQFMEEIKQLSLDKEILKYFNYDTLKFALHKGAHDPNRELISDPHYRVLNQSLVLYRFIKNFY